MIRLDPEKYQERLDEQQPQAAKRRSFWRIFFISTGTLLLISTIFGMVILASVVRSCDRAFEQTADNIVKIAEDFKKLSEIANIDISEEEALYITGEECYNSGEYAAAIESFTKASEMGHAGATYYLGLCYRDGKGVDKDSNKSIEYFQLAADQGSLKAQAELAKYYVNNGMKDDADKALEVIQRAANEGDEEAKKMLSTFEEQKDDIVEEVKTYIPTIEDKAKDLGLDIDLSKIKISF